MILSFDQSKRQNFDRDKTLNKTIPPLFLRLMNITSNLQITQTIVSASDHYSSRPAIPLLPSFEQIAAQVDETAGVWRSPRQNRSPARVQHSQSTPLSRISRCSHLGSTGISSLSDAAASSLSSSPRRSPRNQTRHDNTAANSNFGLSPEKVLTPIKKRHGQRL